MKSPKKRVEMMKDSGKTLFSIVFLVFAKSKGHYSIEFQMFVCVCFVFWGVGLNLGVFEFCGVFGLNLKVFVLNSS